MHYSWCQHKKAVGNFCSLSNCLPIIVELCSFFIATFIAFRHLKIIFTNMSTMGLIYHPYVASLFIHRPTSITWLFLWEICSNIETLKTTYFVVIVNGRSYLGAKYPVLNPVLNHLFFLSQRAKHSATSSTMTFFSNQ